MPGHFALPRPSLSPQTTHADERMWTSATVRRSLKCQGDDESANTVPDCRNCRAPGATVAAHGDRGPKALRLTKDEWVKALYGHENPPSAQDVIEGQLIQMGCASSELGNNVVIDYGL